MTDGPLLWYLNRGSGLVIMVLLTVSVVLGVLSVGRRPGRALPAFVTQDLHRNIALMSVVALVAHVVTAVADTFVDIRWWQALVPIGATYEPLWLGLGTLSLDLIGVIVVTSLLRSRLNHRLWSRVHLLSWVSWALGVVHGIGIGTDLRDLSGMAVTPTALSVAAVLLAGGYRVSLLVTRRRTPAAVAP